MVTRAAFSGDWTFGFFSREAMGHVSVVGFVRRRLDVHKSEKLSHGLLGCWILTQSHGGYEMSWSLDPADKHV